MGSEIVFIDGTRIEANANRYTFVWKKAVTKNLAKMMEKVISFVAKCETMHGLQIVYNDRISLRTLKRLPEHSTGSGWGKGSGLYTGAERKDLLCRDPSNSWRSILTG